MQMDELEPRWHALVTTCGVDPTRARPAYRKLVAAYGEPHRAYHNLTHLVHFFQELDAIPLRDSAVEWATWYHDAIYEPGAPDNEVRSAELAGAAMTELRMDARLTRRVMQLIEATSTHGASGDDTTMSLFLDADMAILGTEPSRYAAYADAIRTEHRHIPSFLYWRGRKALLKGMLDRPVIYITEYFQDRYERQARANMASELEKL
jgi:predicted metal-dependent HD superfamily phosphohydrolase